MTLSLNSIRPELRTSAIAVALMFGMFLLTYAFWRSIEDNGGSAFVMLETFLAPMVAGFFAGRAWKRQGLSTKAQTGHALACVAATLLLIGLFKIEGVICLLIVSPLIWAFFLLGAVAGSSTVTLKTNEVRVSLAVLALVVLGYDLTASHHYATSVSDELVIQAPPSVVWQHVAEYPPITAKPSFWLFRIGMPRPLLTTISAPQQGASRRCIFSNGVTFEERMTVYQPEHELTFDINHQPADPEILGHLTLQRGQFLLRSNGHGGTILTGTSWYELHIFPAWYFDLWAKAITSNVHQSAMQHIKELSEHGS